jgi:hypothetical protein
MTTNFSVEFMIANFPHFTCLLFYVAYAQLCYSVVYQHLYSVEKHEYFMVAQLVK